MLQKLGMASARISDNDLLLMYAAARSPKGGTVIDGRRFAGGQWIPGDVMAKASDAVKAKVKATAQQHKTARAQRGAPDKAAIKKRLAPHAKHELTAKERTSLKRSLAALRDHHGDLTGHRIEELIRHAEKTHKESTGETKDAASRRLKILHTMLDEIGGDERASAEARSEAKPPVGSDTVDIPALAAKLKTFESEEISSSDVTHGALAWEAIKRDYGEFTPHHIEDRVAEHLEQLRRLPKGATENRLHHRKHLALLAWMLDRWREEKIEAPVEGDFAESLDRISWAEKRRAGKRDGKVVTSPWTAYLIKSIRQEFDLGDNPKHTDYVSAETIWNRLKEGKYAGARMDKALRNIPREYGTMSQNQLRKVLPHLRERDDVITPEIIAAVLPKAKSG